MLYLLFMSWFICSRRWCIHKLEVFHANQISMAWSTSEFRIRLAPWNLFKPSSKLFYWPFQGGTSCVDHLNVFSVFCFYAFVRVRLVVPCGNLLGNGWPLGSRFVVSNCELSFSHWYPGSGVVLDCINSWSLHPYLLLFNSSASKRIHYSCEDGIENKSLAIIICHHSASLMTEFSILS